MAYHLREWILKCNNIGIRAKKKRNFISNRDGKSVVAFFYYDMGVVHHFKWYLFIFTWIFAITSSPYWNKFMQKTHPMQSKWFRGNRNWMCDSNVRKTFTRWYINSLLFLFRTWFVWISSTMSMNCWKWLQNLHMNIVYHKSHESFWLLSMHWNMNLVYLIQVSTKYTMM